VHFEGADVLTEGHYGTGISIHVAMDKVADVIIAYEMNNEKLPPDHGFPCRLVIPGYVGGRMVKWLTKITVSDKQTENFYHWHDNIVFPPEVSFENAASWFMKPSCIQSKIT
jgi:nitrate reductase (NAD(P)H)